MSTVFKTARAPLAVNLVKHSTGLPTPEDAMETVSFTEMKHGTQQDYVLLDRYEQENAALVADLVLSALSQLRHGLAGYQIDRLTHSLQSAVPGRGRRCRRRMGRGRPAP